MFASSETGIFRANAYSLFIIGNRFVLSLLNSKYLRPFAVDPTTPPEIAECFWGLGMPLFAHQGYERPTDVYRAA